MLEESCDVVIESIISRNKLSDSIQDPKLHQAFNQLTKRQINILEFYFINGYTHSEIAKFLNISQQAVSKNFRKALQKLKHFYQREKNNG